MNQDTVPNLYDFPAREYGIQGRWPSPDSAGISSIHPRDPRTLNRYAYVRNNPLKLTDPTGMEDTNDGEDGAGGGGDGGGGGGGGGVPDPGTGPTPDPTGGGTGPAPDPPSDPNQPDPTQSPAPDPGQPSNPDPSQPNPGGQPDNPLPQFTDPQPGDLGGSGEAVQNGSQNQNQNQSTVHTVCTAISLGGIYSTIAGMGAASASGTSLFAILAGASASAAAPVLGVVGTLALVGGLTCWIVD